MKKYNRPTAKIFAIPAGICLMMIIVGCTLILAKIDQLEIILLLLFMGSLMGILFLAVFIAEFKAYLLMDDEKISFHLDHRTARFLWKRNTVYYRDIDYISVRLVKGVNLLTADAYYFDFHLKNGDKFAETFWMYGKKQEREIRENLARHVRMR